MHEIQFEESTHTYVVDGVEYPCVSDILRFLKNEIYADIPKSIIENAAERGTRIHKQIEAMDLNGTCEVDIDTKHHVLEYNAFFRKFDPEWLLIEKPFFHPELNYCGTIDRYGIIGGVRWLLDIKTVSNPNEQMIGAQLSAYSKLLEIAGYPVEKVGYLHLYKDKKYRLKELPNDDSLFMACHKIHFATAKKERK